MAIKAMGGAARLAGVRSARYDIIGRREEAEQSTRQAPFQIEYDRETRIVDCRRGAVDRAIEATFPSTAPDQSVIPTRVVATLAGAVMKTPGVDRAAGRRDREQADDILHDEPMVLLQAAVAKARIAPDTVYAMHQRPMAWGKVLGMMP